MVGVGRHLKAHLIPTPSLPPDQIAQVLSPMSYFFLWKIKGMINYTWECRSTKTNTFTKCLFFFSSWYKKAQIHFCTDWRGAYSYQWISFCWRVCTSSAWSQFRFLLTLTRNRLSSNVSCFCIPEKANFQYRTDPILLYNNDFHVIFLLQEVMLVIFRKHSHLT